MRELDPENQCGQHPGVLPQGLASSPRASRPPTGCIQAHGVSGLRRALLDTPRRLCMPRRPHPRLALCAHEDTGDAYFHTATQHTSGLAPTSGHSHRLPRSKMLSGTQKRGPARLCVGRSPRSFPRPGLDLHRHSALSQRCFRARCDVKHTCLHHPSTALLPHSLQSQDHWMGSRLHLPGHWSVA